MRREISPITALSFLILILSATCSFAQSTANEVEPGLLIRRCISQGDSAFHRFANEKALADYQEALDLHPNEYPVLWRISRVLVEIGEHKPKDVQLPSYEDALQFAERAISANPNGWEGYTYRAIAFGKIALHKGVWKSIGLAKKIKKDCEKAIEINPGNDIAMYVLGRTHQKVSEKGKLFRLPLGLGWAGKKKARSLYEAALKYRPDLVVYNIDYARLLIDMKEYDGARSVLKRIAAMPIVDQDDKWNKGNAAKLLEEINVK